MHSGESLVQIMVWWNSSSCSASKKKKWIVKVPQNHSLSSLHWVENPDYSWTLVIALLWDLVVFNKNLKFLQQAQACRLRCSSVGCGLTPVVAATAVSGVVESQSPGRGRQDTSGMIWRLSPRKSEHICLLERKKGGKEAVTNQQRFLQCDYFMDFHPYLG